MSGKKRSICEESEALNRLETREARGEHVAWGLGHASHRNEGAQWLSEEE